MRKESLQSSSSALSVPLDWNRREEKGLLSQDGWVMPSCLRWRRNRLDLRCADEVSEGPDERALLADQEAMQSFITQRHCSSGVLSQFLDDPIDWRWRMGGGEAYHACGEPRVEAQPSDSFTRPEKSLVPGSSSMPGYSTATRRISRSWVVSASIVKRRGGGLTTERQGGLPDAGAEKEGVRQYIYGILQMLTAHKLFVG
jgi:hypothetical protein